MAQRLGRSGGNPGDPLLEPGPLLRLGPHQQLADQHVVLQHRRGVGRGAALDAGLDDGQRQVVAEVGVGPCEGELHRPHPPVVPRVDQRLPGVADLPARPGGVQDVEVLVGEQHPEPLDERRVPDLAGRDPPLHQHGHPQVHPVEAGDPVPGVQPRPDRPHPLDDLVGTLRGPGV